MESDEIDQLDEKTEDAVQVEKEHPVDKSLVELAADSDTHSYLCTVCGKSYKNKRTLDRHNKAQHSGHVLICQDCGKTFSRNQTLKVHRAKAHDMDVESSGLRACPYKDCGKAFEGKAKLKDHINCHMKIKSHKCSKCVKTFTSRYEKNRHEKSCGRIETDAVWCKICNKSFSSRSTLAVHNATHRNKVFSCDRCFKEYKYITGLYNHRAKCKK